MTYVMEKVVCLCFVSIMCPVSMYLHGLADRMSCMQLSILKQVVSTLIVQQSCICSFSFLLPAPDSPAVTVSLVESTSDYPADTNISLQCSWDISVYYVAWYKNGVLFYLSAVTVLIGPPRGVNIGNDFTTMMSNLSIVRAAFNDSGNYTCAVTCRAKGVEFGMIEGSLTDTAEVFVYGE